MYWFALFHRASEHAAGFEPNCGSVRQSSRQRSGLQARSHLSLRVAAEGMDRIHHQRALHGNELPQPESPRSSSWVIRPRRRWTFRRNRNREDGAEEARVRQLRIRCLGKVLRGCAFDDGMIRCRQTGRGLADKFFFVVELESKSMKSHPGKEGMKDSFVSKSATAEV